MAYGYNAEGSAGAARLGSFELDCRARELRRDGRTIRLQEQPFQILRMLLERPGQVVLREEIRNELWPNDIQVEFDQSINAAVKRLRDALGDSADKPRYIETMARRGYRLICPVEKFSGEPACRANGAQPLTSPPVTNTRAAEDLARTSPAKRARWWALAPMLGVTLSISWIALRTTRSRQPVSQPLIGLDVDLGSDVALGPVVKMFRSRGADTILSPDGTRLVYVSQSRLFARRLNQPKPIELAGTEGAYAPFFSPDGSGLRSSQKGS